jgi:hypothetical protein
MSKETKEIKLPEDLYAELKEKVELDENYDSVEDLVVFLLDKIVSEKKELKKN